MMGCAPALLLALASAVGAGPARDPVEAIRHDPDYVEQRIHGVGLGAWGGPLRLDVELDPATHLPTRSIWIDRSHLAVEVDPFAGKTEVALIAQIYPSEGAAFAAIRTIPVPQSAVIYGYYRGELGIIFPTVISLTTAPRVTQALRKVLELERGNAKAASVVLLESVLALGGARVPLVAPASTPAVGRLIFEAGRAASPEELEVATLLVREGRTVRVLAEGAERTADFLVDGLPTELKTVSKLTAKDLSGALCRRILDGAGQAPNIIIDGRRQAGLTVDLAREAIRRAYFADKVLQRLANIRILGEGFDVIIPRPVFLP